MQCVVTMFECFRIALEIDVEGNVIEKENFHSLTLVATMKDGATMVASAQSVGPLLLF
jgi:hypothetical protein